jgi:Flp pilus assembly protein TadG
MRIRKSPSLAREDGAAAVEFALLAPLLVLLLFGLIEYGVAFWQVQNLRAATREAARVAAVGGDSTDIQTALVNASSGSLPPGYTGYSVSPTNGCIDSTDPGEPVTVTINNGSLPSGVSDALTVNIPFLPEITLDPELTGTFRCE